MALLYTVVDGVPSILAGKHTFICITVLVLNYQLCAYDMRAAAETATLCNICHTHPFLLAHMHTYTIAIETTSGIHNGAHTPSYNNCAQDLLRHMRPVKTIATFRGGHAKAIGQINITGCRRVCTPCPTASMTAAYSSCTA